MLGFSSLGAVFQNPDSTDKIHECSVIVFMHAEILTFVHFIMILVFSVGTRDSGDSGVGTRESGVGTRDAIDLGFNPLIFHLLSFFSSVGQVEMALDSPSSALPLLWFSLIMLLRLHCVDVYIHQFWVSHFSLLLFFFLLPTLSSLTCFVFFCFLTTQTKQLEHEENHCRRRFRWPWKTDHQVTFLWTSINP